MNNVIHFKEHHSELNHFLNIYKDDVIHLDYKNESALRASFKDTHNRLSFLEDKIERAKHEFTHAHELACFEKILPKTEGSQEAAEAIFLNLLNHCDDVIKDINGLRCWYSDKEEGFVLFDDLERSLVKLIKLTKSFMKIKIQ